MTKSLGQVAAEAYEASGKDIYETLWDTADADWKARWELAAAAVVNACETALGILFHEKDETFGRFERAGAGEDEINHAHGEVDGVGDAMQVIRRLKARS